LTAGFDNPVLFYQGVVCFQDSPLVALFLSGIGTAVKARHPQKEAGNEQDSAGENHIAVKELASHRQSSAKIREKGRQIIPHLSLSNKSSP
jgi:hypothetical protein